MASILLFAMVNHITPASGKAHESEVMGVGIRPAKVATPPDRDAQFHDLNAQVTAARAAGEPAIAVDTKKKELVGNSKNAGQSLRLKGNQKPVRGRTVHYGVYDIAGNHPARRWPAW
jgi:hypothetical protein